MISFDLLKKKKEQNYVSYGEVGWDCKGWWLGLDTSVLLFKRDCGVPARGFSLLWC